MAKGRILTRADLVVMRETLKRKEWTDTYVQTSAPTVNHERPHATARNRALRIARAVPGVTLVVLRQSVSERTIRRAVADGALTVRENRVYVA